jgi:hypothetical protein
MVVMVFIYQKLDKYLTCVIQIVFTIDCSGGYYSWNIIKNMLHSSTNVYNLIVHVKPSQIRLLKYVGIAMTILLKKNK